MTPTQSAPPTPNARAVTRARELFIAANGAMGQRYACALALAAVAGCRWSPDQLKARAFGGVVFNGFGLAAPVDARPTIPAPAPEADDQEPSSEPAPEPCYACQRGRCNRCED